MNLEAQSHRGRIGDETMKASHFFSRFKCDMECDLKQRRASVFLAIDTLVVLFPLAVLFFLISM